MSITRYNKFNNVELRRFVNDRFYTDDAVIDFSTDKLCIQDCKVISEVDGEPFSIVIVTAEGSGEDTVYREYRIDNIPWENRYDKIYGFDLLYPIWREEDEETLIGHPNGRSTLVSVRQKIFEVITGCNTEDKLNIEQELSKLYKLLGISSFEQIKPETIDLDNLSQSGLFLDMLQFVDPTLYKQLQVIYKNIEVYQDQCIGNPDRVSIPNGIVMTNLASALAEIRTAMGGIQEFYPSDGRPGYTDTAKWPQDFKDLYNEFSNNLEKYVKNGDTNSIIAFYNKVEATFEINEDFADYLEKNL